MTINPQKVDQQNIAQMEDVERPGGEGKESKRLTERNVRRQTVEPAVHEGEIAKGTT